MSRRTNFRNIFLTATLLVATTVVVQAQNNEWTVPQNNDDNIGFTTQEPQEEDNNPTFTSGNSNPNSNPPTPQAADAPPPGLPINNWVPGFLLIAGVFGVYILKTTRKEA
ncbi:hypothetical protein [Haloflavibacter putidus]|uniref:PGF-CTERM protein n=1 Tax=Haloflavibacter putidus TaxID=2576776 RepID=A0A507ZWP0_9FLAO|nr:hypothetical protein [Haloflavibacter putidus]TQD40684.1 hypothetical protein FKR84_01505 [Haloflavibacter putidus]